MGQFLFTDSFNLYSASRLLASDSETAFSFFENLFRVICLCLLIIFLFYCLSFCSDVSNCLCMWGYYKIVFLFVYFTIV